MVITNTPIDTDDERRILINMIVSTAYLDAMVHIVDPVLFETSYGRTLSSWVLEYYNIAKKAPDSAIQDVYREKRKLLKEEDAEPMAMFLTSLSSEPRRNNIAYDIECHKKYFSLQRLKKVQKRLERALLNGDTGEGEKAIGDYKRPTSGCNGFSLFALENKKKIRDAFDREDKVLFSFPGDLGKVVKPFSRGDFASFLAPMKRGKSWAMMYSVQRAFLSGLNVAYFNLEMPEDQTIRRFWQMFMGVPEEQCDIVLPYFVDNDDGDHTSGCSIAFLRETRDGVRTDDETLGKQLEFMAKNGDGGEVRMFNFPPNQFKPRDLRDALFNLEKHDNFIPDVVVVDYADVMEPDVNLRDDRANLNSIWLSLRSLALEKHIAVITASQSNRETVDGKEAKSGNIAGDIRKVAHVTKLVVLNQSDKEAEHGIMRITNKVVREGKTIWSECCVLQCLDIARFHLDSRMANVVENLDDFRGETEKPSKKY